jgi:hypothetical protein
MRWKMVAPACGCALAALALSGGADAGVKWPDFRLKKASTAPAEAPAPAKAERPKPGPKAEKPLPAKGWTYGKTYASSWELYEAMRAAAGGGTRMTWQRLPDWTGLWSHADGFNFDPQQRGPKATVALTPEYQQRYDRKMDNIKKGVEWDPLSSCLPAGFPRWLLEPFLREYILRPEQAWLITEQQNEIRRVYTDGRGHVPDDEAYPLWEGDSIGFWDGDTLVIHTKNLMAGQYQRQQPDHSDQVSTVERMRKTGPDTIEDIVDVYDPLALQAPWHVRHTYTRVTTPNLRINHWSCEENNNVVRTDNGTSTFLLPGEKGYRDPNSLTAPPQTAAPSPGGR